MLDQEKYSEEEQYPKPGWEKGTSQYGMQGARMELHNAGPDAASAEERNQRGTAVAPVQSEERIALLAKLDSMKLWELVQQFRQRDIPLAGIRIKKRLVASLLVRIVSGCLDGRNILVPAGALPAGPLPA